MFGRLFLQFLQAGLRSLIIGFLIYSGAIYCGTPETYNAGDPTSGEFLKTQLLRCAVGDATVCPTTTTPTIAAPTFPLTLALGNAHTCGRHRSGRVRCWGGGTAGKLGYDNLNNVGNGVGLTIQQAGDVNIGGTVVQIVAGSGHNCVLLDTGNVRCWGQNNMGQLGYDSTTNVGDGVGPGITTAGDVNIGGTTAQIVAGDTHTCALLDTGKVRCWGSNGSGQLGHGHTNNIGDGVGPTIIVAGDINVGGTVTQIDAGISHTCALLDTGAIRCWGKNNLGQLGYDNTNNVGDGVGPAITAVGDVPVGATIQKITLGSNFTCALLADNNVRCWGSGGNGFTGYNATTPIGDGGTSIIAAGNLNLGGTAADLSTGSTITCVKLQTGAVRCWGQGGNGRLGYGNTNNVGDGVGQSIAAAGDISTGVTALTMYAGYRSSCVTISETEAKCWGHNTSGTLGLNHANHIGDDELPGTAGITTIF